MRKVYRFYKEDNDWFVDLPEYIEQGGTQADLQMVAGADIWLEEIAKGKDSVQMMLSDDVNDLKDSHFTLSKSADLLLPFESGMYYSTSEFITRVIWLCDVTKWVFKGKFPKTIFCKIIE